MTLPASLLAAKPGHELAAERHKLSARGCIEVARFYRRGGHPYDQNSGLPYWTFGDALDAASSHVRKAIWHRQALRMGPAQGDLFA